MKIRRILLFSLFLLLQLAVISCKSCQVEPPITDLDCPVEILTTMQKNARDVVSTASSRNDIAEEKVKKLKVAYQKVQLTAEIIINLIQLAVITDTEKPKIKDAATKYVNAVYNLRNMADMPMIGDDIACMMPYRKQIESQPKTKLKAFGVGDLVKGIILGVTESIIKLNEAKRQAHEEKIKQVNEFLDRFKLEDWK